MKNITIMMMFLMLVLTSACQKGKQGGNEKILKPNVIAVVNGQEITRQDFEKRHQWYTERYKFKVPAEQFLRNLVELELAYQEALNRKLEKDEKFQYDYKVLLSQYLLEREVYKKFENLNLSDDELKKYFESSPEIRASHILFKVDPKAAPEEVEKVKAKAKEVLKKVKAGEDFKKLAVKYSDGPSAKNAGDLDYFSRDSMVAEFSKAAFALKNVGDVSDLVRTQYGFHIIKLTGIRKFKEADKKRLQTQALANRQREIYETFFEGLKKNASIAINQPLLEEKGQ